MKDCSQPNGLHSMDIPTADWWNALTGIPFKTWLKRVSWLRDSLLLMHPVMRHIYWIFQTRKILALCKLDCHHLSSRKISKTDSTGYVKTFYSFIICFVIPLKLSCHKKVRSSQFKIFCYFIICLNFRHSNLCADWQPHTIWNPFEPIRISGSTI